MKKIKLGNSDIEISQMGLGLMGMSPNVYGGSNDNESLKVIDRAIELGVNLLDTADTYGNGHNEKLVSEAIKGRRNQIILASKFGYGENWQYVGAKPSYVKEAVESSLLRLGTDYIDIYYLHALDPNTPIEETVQAMSELVKEGKVKALGLSNGMTPELLRRANAVHPISALQTEYNLWTREDEEALIPTAKELGITHVGYAPLSRGFISGQLKTFDDLEATDIRRYLPRFQPDVFHKNVEIVDLLDKMAKEKSATTAQLAIAWVMSKGSIPIPGTKHIKYLEENIQASEIHLTADEIKELDKFTENNSVNGKNY